MNKLNITSEIWSLEDKDYNKVKNNKSICIHKSVLDKVDFNIHDSVNVYDVKINEIDSLSQTYINVKNWIYDL